ncbi:MAG: hypothetical protein MJ150_02980 [Clostridia bacterium]|nr:hypothetical protein [Clostridia bacterium]
MEKVNFLPILLGSDINTYSMARAFHEEYGITSVMVARARGGITGEGLTNLFTYIEDPKLDETEVFMKKMKEIMAEFGKEKTLILIGTNDHYVRRIVENKYELKDMGFIIPYSDLEVLDKIVLKESFYKLCDEYNVPYPKTFIYKPGMDFESIDADFPFPGVLKASDSVDFHRYKFPGFQKAYFPKTRQECVDTLKLIYAHGYSGNMILQDLIPGDDANEYDLQMYIGSDHKAKLLNLGNVLLEEHTPTAIGNNAATLTICDPEIMHQVSSLLEAIGYEGLADADMKLDPRDGQYKVFEINIRQGRSNYRVTGAGYNLAKYVVDDYLYHKDIPLTVVDKPHFWHVVPLGLVYKLVKDKDKVAQVKKLVAEGKVCDSTNYKKDMPLKRWFYLKARQINFYRKFNKYYPK